MAQIQCMAPSALAPIWLSVARFLRAAPRAFGFSLGSLCLVLALLLSRSAFAQTPEGYTVRGNTAFGFFGQSVACLPDFNAPNTSSLAVGAPFVGTGGRTLVLDGPTGLTTQLSFEPGDPFAESGWSLAYVGNVGLSVLGLSDLLMGEPSSDPMITSSRYRVFGGPNGSNQVQGFGPSSFDSRFGESVAGLFGDTNGNGLNDFIIGASNANGDGGQVELYDIAATSPLLTLQGSNGELLGSAVLGVSDLNGDGAPDFLVGARGSLNGFGSVYGFGSVDGTELFRLDGSASFDQFGSSLALLSDINADGRLDFVVGAPSGESSGPGRAFVFSLNGSATPTLVCTLSGQNVNDSFGEAVAFVGDTNGNGIDEFAIGAPNADGGRGSVQLYEFNVATNQCEQVSIFFGTDSNDRFGSSIAGSHVTRRCDFRSAGSADFAVGAPLASSPPSISEAGAVRVFFGALAPTPTPTPPPSDRPPSRANFNFTIRETGLLTGSVTLNQAPITPCRVSVYGRTTRANLSSPGPLFTLIRRKSLVQRRLRFRAARLRRAFCSSDGNPYSLHALAEVRCASKTFYSNVRARQTACGRSPPLSIREWENQVVSRVRIPEDPPL